MMNCQPMPPAYNFHPGMISQSMPLSTMTTQMPSMIPTQMPSMVNSQPTQTPMNFQQMQPSISSPSLPPAMIFPPMQPLVNSQHMQGMVIPQPMPPHVNSQQMQGMMIHQPMQPPVNSQPMQPYVNSQQMQAHVNSQQMQAHVNSQPMQHHVNSQQMQAMMFPQPTQQGFNSQAMQSGMNYSVDDLNQSSLNYTCVTAVSKNFLLKLILSSTQLKNLKKGQSCDISSGGMNPFFFEINSDYHLNFKPSDNWESVDLVYAFVETKERAFSLEDSAKLSFLDPFDPSCVNDEDITIHCMVIAYPSCSNTDQYQGTVSAEFRTVSTIALSPEVLPSLYKNEKVNNFIRRGIIPNLNVDVAIEIIGETNVHKCKVLSILCTEYLIKNVTSKNLAKVLKVATENRIQILQEKIVEEMEKFEIMLKENKTEKCELTTKKNKTEKCEIVEEDNKTKENKKRKNEAEKMKKEKEN